MAHPPAHAEDALATLAARALNGEARAAEDLCRSLQGPLYRLAARLLRDPEDARDATQESLILVITHLSTFRAESRLMTWAYAIALRHILRSRRQRERRASRLALEFKIRAGMLLTERDAVPEGETAVARRETCLGCTRAMLQSLSLEERAAIVLSEILGADDQLGAQLTDVPDATYRKRLSRARAKLRPVMEDLCGLTSSANPCSCDRQARAKQRLRMSPRPALPIIADREVVTAAERLGEVRALGAILAGPAALAPPEELWSRVRSHLAPVLDAR
ncbi:MAG: RNA polymerase sigma factor [Deltaproteobacteria bacterium]|nr:RNA polymerase sigma factor [Deltaproteobacteria bacterium]